MQSAEPCFFLRPTQCVLTSLCLFCDGISFREILTVIFRVRQSADENALFSLISYSKERRFSVFQTLPDF